MGTTVQPSSDATWLSAWDERMIGYLDEIAGVKSPPPMQLLFFANTFPLIYHYGLALKRRGKDPNKYIHAGWLNEDVKAPNTIRYTNKNNSEANNVTPVTIFNPKWAFVPLSLATNRIWQQSRNEDPTSPIPKVRRFLEVAKSSEYNSLWVYAELEDLGLYLRSLTDKIFPCQSAFYCQGPDGNTRLPAFETTHPDKHFLRLFIFGGPLSTYFRSKASRYLPLSLDGVAPTKKMQLYVSGPSDYLLALQSYHSALYADSLAITKAKATPSENPSAVNCPPFFSVYRSYNEMAWLLQHRSSFKDAFEFAGCIADHHLAATTFS